MLTKVNLIIIKNDTKFVVKKKLGGIGDEKMVVQKEIIRYPKLGGGCSEMWKVEKYTSERNHDLW